MASRSGNSDRKPAAQPPYVRRLDAWHAGFFLLGLLVAAFAARMVLLPRNPAAPPAAEASATPTLPGGNPGPWGRIEYTSIELERPDESLNRRRHGGPAHHMVLRQPPGRPGDGAVPDQPPDGGAAQPTDQPSPLVGRQQRLAHSPPRRTGSQPRRPGPPGHLHRAGQKPAQPVPQPSLLHSPRQVRRLAGATRACPTTKKRSSAASPTGRARTFVSPTTRSWNRSAPSTSANASPKPSPKPPAWSCACASSPATTSTPWPVTGAADSRGKAMKPFLASLARVPGGISVSISYFLPEFARMRLYTYPDPEGRPGGAARGLFLDRAEFRQRKARPPVLRGRPRAPGPQDRLRPRDQRARFRRSDGAGRFQGRGHSRFGVCGRRRRVHQERRPIPSAPGS